MNSNTIPENRLFMNPIPLGNLDNLADDFENDAKEGLQHVSNPIQLSNTVAQLNKQLEKKLGTKQLKKRKPLMDINGTITTVLIVLTICCLAFGVIYLLKH